MSTVVALFAAGVVFGILNLAPSRSSEVGPDSSSVSCTARSCNSNSLNDIACSGDSFCVAVGSYRTESQHQRTLIEEWDGSSWSLDKSPNSAKGKDVLASVSCVSREFCVAVGWDNLFESGFTKVIELWNGSTWKMVDIQAKMFAKLEGVRCSSPIQCVAVGYNETATSAPGTLVMQWNGEDWSLLPSANVVGGNAMINVLDGVSCLNPKDCFAVGDYVDLNNEQGTEISKWNGTAWKLVPSPSPGRANNALSAVSCPSSRLCFAVGGYNADSLSSVGFHSMIEQWNGSSWMVVTTPKPSRSNDYLSGVACASPALCFAVGVQDRDFAGTSIIDKWDGSRWTVTKLPAALSERKMPLNGVTCLSATNCYAVGSYASGSGNKLSLIEHWNGSNWKGVSAPNDFN